MLVILNVVLSIIVFRSKNERKLEIQVRNVLFQVFLVYSDQLHSKNVIKIEVLKVITLFLWL